MNAFQKIFVPIAVLVLAVAATRTWGWPGLAVVAGGVVMWILLHFTRMMTILKRAAERPVGYIGSAVMLNAKLTEGVNLMHVIALTRALGERLSPENTEPEIYRWTDNSQSQVTCEFRGGKLRKWELVRPSVLGELGPVAEAPPQAPPAP